MKFNAYEKGKFEGRPAKWGPFRNMQKSISDDGYRSRITGIDTLGNERVFNSQDWEVQVCK